jgi:hypothetical protein
MSNKYYIVQIWLCPPEKAVNFVDLFRQQAIALQPIGSANSIVITPSRWL